MAKLKKKSNTDKAKANEQLDANVLCADFPNDWDAYQWRDKHHVPTYFTNYIHFVFVNVLWSFMNC